MKLHVESVLRFPLDLVFRTYRDRLPELVPYLPNVRSIVVEKREDAPPITKLVNVWHGGADIPAVVRTVLSERMLSWTDHARWDESQHTCEWRMEAHSFREAVHAAGKNRFVEAPGGGTTLVIDGDLTIDGKKIPGVPRFLAGRVGSAVEGFLVAAVKPNLTEVAKGIVRFLQANPAER